MNKKRKCKVGVDMKIMPIVRSIKEWFPLFLFGFGLLATFLDTYFGVFG